MSVKLFFWRNRILLAAGLGSVTLAGFVSLQNGSHVHRGPASVEHSHKHEESPRRIFGKGDQIASVRIRAVDGFPTSNNEVATLRAIVKVRKNFPSGIHLQWTLPEGTELVSGQLQETVPNVRKGDRIKREIVMRGFSSEGLPRNVTLEASAAEQGAAVSFVGVFKSHPTNNDLSIGFRESKEEARERRNEKMRTQSDEEAEFDSAPKLPKGIHF